MKLPLPAIVELKDDTLLLEDCCWLHQVCVCGSVKRMPKDRSPRRLLSYCERFAP
jgi:hypothetical protein